MKYLLPKIKMVSTQRRGNYFSKIDDKTPCLIAYIDIMNFSFLGFKYGYRVTNKILNIICERISRYVTKDDFLENIYADDFILILKGQLDECEKKLLKIKEEIEKPIRIDNEFIELNFRIAVIRYPFDFNDIQEAYNYVILFCKYLKKQKGSGIYFLDEFAFPILKKLRKFTNFILTKDFPKHLMPALQGIWDLNTSELYGYEVLSRIQYDGKIYSASQFMDVLEYFKMNLKSDEIIINKALQYKLETKDQHVYFFNIIPKFFYQYVELITHIFKNFKNSIDLGQICIELTEISEFSEFEDINNTILKLKEKYGIKFAIDDFGSGYSNLNVFTTLHVDFLKIDKELIDKTINEPITGYLLKSISELSLFRNIAIIGEGIDSPFKLRLINKIGFDYGQGYYLSKPEIPTYFLTDEKDQNKGEDTNLPLYKL